MAKFRTSQSELDEAKKSMVLSAVSYYTSRDGCLDTEKINPVTLVTRFDISLEEGKGIMQQLLSEGKIEKLNQ